MKTLDENEIRAVVGRVVDEHLGRVTGGGTAAMESPAKPREPDERGAVAIGADHGGFALKEELAAHLRQGGWAVVDCGTYSQQACDYPDFAHEVARRVADGGCRWGIVVDGAGIGSAMVANKVPGVRAAACYDVSAARNSREHNHANVLTLGAGFTGVALAKQIADTWLGTPWGGDRHARRVEKIIDYEGRYLR